MKQISRILYAATVLAVAVSCAAPKTAIDELPELPADLAADLEQDPTAPVLRSKAPPPEPPADPPAPPQPAVPVPRSCTTTYLTQATYPVVVCHPPSELIDVMVSQASGGGGDARPSRPENLGEIDRVERAAEERYFKLTAHGEQRLAIGFFCRVHGGPWSAVAEETTQCTFGLPNLWELRVAAADLELLWFGNWEDMPAYPSLYVFQGDRYELGEECSCCGGYKYCEHTQSCIDQSEECKPPVPQ